MTNMYPLAKKIALLFGILSLGYGCKMDEKSNTKELQKTHIETTTPSNTLGMNYTKSNSTFSETYSTLKSIIEANPNIGIMAEVDHARNASNASLALPPTKIMLFGNPNLGTPLMQRNQLAAIDLPQKILVHENQGEVRLSFNSVQYLSKRHGLEGVGTLSKIENALTKLSTTAGNGSTLVAEAADIGLGEGLVTKTSSRSFEDTYNALENAISNNPKLRIIAQVNHQANAAKVGQELPPTRLIIFGNPNLGTPLMQNAQTTALDLPQKMLVWENKEGVVHVSYNAPSFLVARHGITQNETILQTISGALDKLSGVAIGN